MLIQNTACHLVMGFLGAGKTSFINACIASLQQGQKWAILVNEVGQIGIDEALYQTDDESPLAIRQVSGGCICCTSQLPLQIALARLLADNHPDRLWIEPTGMAHPQELLSQLAEPHWQTALSLKSAVSILNAKQWQQPRYRDHDGYQAHVRFCDVVVVNRFNDLTQSEIADLTAWLNAMNPSATILWQAGNRFEDAFASELQAILAKPSQVLSQRQHYRQVSLVTRGTSMLNRGINTAASEPENTNPELPFRYHDQQANYQVMGWRLPPDWQVDMIALMDWLMALPNWQRIKSVVNTNQNWQTLNFTPDSLDILASEPQVDNRIEIIFLDNTLVLDFAALDSALMALYQQD
jgi:G3E family GTPase